MEAKAPPLERRLAAIEKLQRHGWQIGLRFDPLLYQSEYEDIYRTFFAQVFAVVDLAQLHSVSLGAFRLPEHFFNSCTSSIPEKNCLRGRWQPGTVWSRIGKNWQLP